MLNTTLAFAVASFCLGACPFSLWLGRLFLRRDIRDYGDGNPGATNVFRAGGRWVGVVAVLLDVSKGIPFVLLARYPLGLPEKAVLAVGMCAILGSAFSPMLRFRGGKSLCVTCGVLLALPGQDVLLVALVLVFLAFLFLDEEAWIVMFGGTGAVTYVVATARSLEDVGFAVAVVALLGWKQRKDLVRLPSFINRAARLHRTEGQDS